MAVSPVVVADEFRELIKGFGFLSSFG